MRALWQRRVGSAKQRHILAPENKWLAEAKHITTAPGEQAGFGWVSIPNKKLETVSGIEMNPLPKM